MTGVASGHSYPAVHAGMVPEATVAKVPAAQYDPAGHRTYMAVVGVTVL